MKAWRIILAAAGIAVLLYGFFLLVTGVPVSTLIVLGMWLIGALVIHDGLLSPAVVSVGWLLRRYVPDRGRRFLQLALIMIMLVTVIATPMIFLRNSQPAVKALLLQNYGANLALIIGIVAVVTLTLYAIRVARDRSTPGVPRVTESGPRR